MRVSGTARKMISAVVFGALILLSAGMTTSTTAQGQTRFRHHHPRTRVIVTPRVFVRPRIFPRYYTYPGPFYYSAPFTYQTPTDRFLAAQEDGYKDGFKRGKDDAKKGRAPSPSSHKHYLNSSNGTYRDAFLRGYDEGYRQYAG